MRTTSRAVSGRRAALVSAVVSSLLLACGDSSPPTRRITGSRTVTYWMDSGKSPPIPSPDTQTPARIGARSLDGSINVSTAFDASGNFTLEGAPAGACLLDFTTQGGVHHFYRTEAANIDLGGDVLGRSDVRFPTQPTQITFDLSGLAQTDPQDVVEITSSNASVWERLAPQGTLGAGLTAASVSFDWKARPTPLVSKQTGDVVFVHQISTRVDPGSGLAYQVAATSAQVPDLTVADGATLDVPLVLAPVASTGRLNVRWRPTQFEAALADWPVNTQVLGHSLFVEGISGPLDLGPGPRSGNPDLVQILAPPGTADATLDLAYGQFLPAMWTERLQTYVTVRLYFPFLNGRIYYSVRMSMQAAMSALPSELVPTIRPPRSVQIGGADTFQVRTGVGTGPLVSWTPPTTGTADYYIVDIERLQISGTSVTFAQAATLRTTEAQAQFPAGTLASGNQYVAFITAFREPTGHYATAPAPNRRHFPQDIAQTATAPFSP